MKIETKSEAVRREVVPAASAIHLFSRLVVLSAFILLFAGALVTSTGSSLAVPDWPLSFGKAMPPMIGGVAFEHGHRMIAGCVALLTFALTFWLRAREPRAWVRGLGYAASFLIVVQALLGGLTVLMRLPPAVSMSHACLAQGVFCLLLAICQMTAPKWTLHPGSRLRWQRGVLAFIAVYFQIALGAVVRHTGGGLWAHIAWAGVVTFFVLRAASIGRRPDLLTPSSLMGLLVPLQLVLGYLSYRIRFAPDFASGISPLAAVTAGHLAAGALLLGSCLIWTMRARRS